MIIITSVITLIITGLLLTIFKQDQLLEQMYWSKLVNYKKSNKLKYLRWSFLVLSSVFLIIAFTEPHWGTKTKTTKFKGIDVVFTLDVSKSMKAVDLGKMSRLYFSKELVKEYIRQNPENRYSLVVFAGESFSMVPLTLDHEALIIFLEGVSDQDISKQGTNLEEALKASISRFKTEEDQKRAKTIILLSDGGEDVSGDFKQFAKIAKKDKIAIHTIGVGSTSPTPIPESQDFWGRISYKQFQGKTVYTKLNEEVLKKISEKTNGQYFHFEKFNEINSINKELSKLKKEVLEKNDVLEEENQYQIFLLISFVFLVLSYKIRNNG